MRIRNLRWWVAVLLALATAINYLDRQGLPVVIGELQKSIPVSAQQYSQLQALFLLAYAIMYAAGGRIVDALGTRADTRSSSDGGCRRRPDADAAAD